MTFAGLWNKLFRPKIDTPTETILVVDDNATDRTLVLNILAKKGYKTLSASDGESAIKMAESLLPDLVILDYMMPGKNGPDVCHILKEKPSTQNIPVIFLTSLDTPISVIECFKEGAEIFLSKPVKPGELLEQIKLSLIVLSESKKESAP